MLLDLLNSLSKGKRTELQRNFGTPAATRSSQDREQDFKKDWACVGILFQPPTPLLPNSGGGALGAAMPSILACPSWLLAHHQQGSTHMGGHLLVGLYHPSQCSTHVGSPNAFSGEDSDLQPLLSAPHATCRSTQPFQRHPEVPMSQERHRSCAHRADLQALPDAHEGAPSSSAVLRGPS